MLATFFNLYEQREHLDNKEVYLDENVLMQLKLEVQHQSIPQRVNTILEFFTEAAKQHNDRLQNKPIKKPIYGIPGMSGNDKHVVIGENSGRVLEKYIGFGLDGRDLQGGHELFLKIDTDGKRIHYDLIVDKNSNIVALKIDGVSQYLPNDNLLSGVLEQFEYAIGNRRNAKRD